MTKNSYKNKSYSLTDEWVEVATRNEGNSNYLMNELRKNKFELVALQETKQLRQSKAQNGEFYIWH